MTNKQLEQVGKKIGADIREEFFGLTIKIRDRFGLRWGDCLEVILEEAKEWFATHKEGELSENRQE